MIWFGIFFFCVSDFSGFEYLSVLSPMFVVFLIVKVSGCRFLEASAKKKWGTDPAYIEYKKNSGLVTFKFWVLFYLKILN